MLTAEYRETEQEHGRDADCDRAEPAAGHLERAFQFGLAKAQNGQSHEFQEQARAVDEDIERNQALETEQQARHPEAGENYDRDPWSFGLRMQLADEVREHAVLGHRERQA